MQKQTISILLAAVMLFSVSTTALSSTTQEPSNAKTQFSSSEMLEDYDHLWDQLRANFPFFPVLERRGIAVESLYFSNREILEDRIKDLNGFVFLLRDTFYRMENFAHLSLMDVDMYDAHISIANIYPFQPRDSLILGTQTKATYELLRVTEASAPITYPEVAVRYLPDSNAAYLHFKSFDFSLHARDQDILVDFLTSLAQVDHIIIDITGNGGGDSQYWKYHIVSPFGGQYEWQNCVFLPKNPVNERFFFDTGLFDIQPISDLPLNYAKPAFVEELGFTHFYKTLSAYPAEDYTGKRVETEAKRWVLIDESVYSSADGFAAFCKSTGWAALVGKTTRGDGAPSISPVVISLKNTGLLVRFSSCTSANTDGTMNAEAGTAPDIFCMDGETPLDACLRAIQGV